MSQYLIIKQLKLLHNSFVLLYKTIFNAILKQISDFNIVKKFQEKK